jgi:hypothetical protein
MHKLVLASIAASAVLTSQAPVGIVTPWSAPGNNPFVNTTIINSDGAGGIVSDIDQFELRHSGAGTYRVECTLRVVGQTDSKLQAGSLNMAVSPPVWTPNQHLAALNMANAAVDEYQCSMSANGLVLVWDNYNASTTYNGFVGQTWVATRASTAVPFATVNVLPVLGVGAGGVDPHIGEELANGNVVLYHIDFLGITPNIVKGELNPATGALINVTVVATYTGAGISGFNHSPFALRDSTGKARCLSYSQYPQVGGAFSHSFFTEGINDDGTPQMILDGSTAGAGGVLTWHNNPGWVGGTFHSCTSAQTEPNLLEVTAIANADLTSGSGRIVAFAPARPLPGGGVFISVIGIGVAAPAPGYALPPVVGNLWVFPTLGVLDLRFHNQYTGLAEWAFTNVPALNFAWEMQLITLDGAAGLIRAGNTARLDT